MKVVNFIGCMIFWTLLFGVSTLTLGPIGFLGALVLYGAYRFFKFLMDRDAKEIREINEMMKEY